MAATPTEGPAGPDSTNPPTAQHGHQNSRLTAWLAAVTAIGAVLTPIAVAIIEKL